MQPNAARPRSHCPTAAREFLMPDLASFFRAIPSTDKCIEFLKSGEAHDLADLALAGEVPHPLLRSAVVDYWENVRQQIRLGRFRDAEEVTLEARKAEMAAHVAVRLKPRMRKVYNGTGVVVHTNTGRSILAKEAVKAIEQAALDNSTLELDVETGGRGSRSTLLTDLFRTLTGAEDALVVNNNAAGVLLVMDTFFRGREVVISRGELVEIGGSFRIPDVMASTGVILREVGTTNRTHPEDYRRAINAETAAIVRVHASNFRVIGFHAEVSTEDLANIAHEHNLLLVNDLGSGSLFDFSGYGLTGEPTVQQALSAGSDLVLFSGDKLLGGPQAGVILGRRELVARLRKNPIMRALRCDKLVYAALEATLRLYLDPETARTNVPTLARILLTKDELAVRARKLLGLLEAGLGDRCRIDLVDSSSRCGGGAFPEQKMPTVLVAIRPKRAGATELKMALLRQDPILLGRLEDEAFCLDARTLPEGELEAIPPLVGRALEAIGG